MCCAPLGSVQGQVGLNLEQHDIVEKWKVSLPVAGSGTASSTSQTISQPKNHSGILWQVWAMAPVLLTSQCQDMSRASFSRADLPRYPTRTAGWSEGNPQPSSRSYRDHKASCKAALDFSELPRTLTIFCALPHPHSFPLFLALPAPSEKILVKHFPLKQKPP